MSKTERVLNAVERKCPVCGKTFIPAPYHIYRYESKIYCGWNCHVSARKEREQKEIKEREEKLNENFYRRRRNKTNKGAHK